MVILGFFSTIYFNFCFCLFLIEYCGICVFQYELVRCENILLNSIDLSHLLEGKTCVTGLLDHYEVYFEIEMIDTEDRVSILSTC